MAGTGGGEPGVPPGAGDINDRLAEIAAELAREAKFKEPSAAERARQAKQAKQAQAAQSRSQRVKNRRDGRSAWSASPVRRSRTVSLAITVAVVVALIAISVGLSRLHPGAGSAAKPDNTPVTNGSTVSPLPTITPPPFTASDPFAGSPAEGFADGAAGIVIPAAHAVGSYSAAQVRAAYATVRKMLIAGHLNAAVLAGGSPKAFARLLIPTERSWFDKNLDKQGLDRHGYIRSSRAWLTSFAPGTAALVGTLIKVHGFMTAKARRSGQTPVLSIHADYLFVYPIQQAGGQPSTRMRIVARTVLTVQFATWNDPGGSLEPWVASALGGPAGILCGINDGFVHPAFPGGPQSPVKPTGKPIDPYDQSIPPSSHGCQPTTGI
jgi:hypothetical protein